MPNEPRGAGRAAALALPLLMWACALGAAHASPAAGETLYRRGLLPSGEPVRAVREAGASMQGTDAACVNCHRRSGLGSSEGRITIPPISGQYLFAPQGKRLEELGIPFVIEARGIHERNAQLFQTLTLRSKQVLSGNRRDGDPTLARSEAAAPVTVHTGRICALHAGTGFAYGPHGLSGGQQPAPVQGFPGGRARMRRAQRTRPHKQWQRERRRAPCAARLVWHHLPALAGDPKEASRLR